MNMPGDDAPLSSSLFYDPHCRLCPRLAAFLHQVKQDHPDFACLPVPPLGPLDAPLLIAGLAPGLKGANASGRPFTGDGAGPLLFGTLTELGLASRPVPVRISDHPSTLRADDGLQLHGCRISNAVKCLPPENKPLPAEIRTCNRFIAAEITAMPNLRVIVALGKVAHDAVLMALGRKASSARFAHAAEHRIGDYILIDSYHCSRYNQNTGRLTAPMFRAVFERALHLLN